jgi:flagella basal body P-ring formation protein FlgA
MMLFLLLAATAPMSGCVALQHDHILGRDLAAAVPAFAALSPESDFGLAPLPGSMRVFPARELKRIAVERGIQAGFANDVCFVWVAKPLTQGALLDAMTKSLAPRRVSIEILDQSSWPAPIGDICLPRSSMSLSSAGIALWRGYVNYAGTRRFDIWVRARISVKENHLVTIAKIPAGHVLSATQFKSDPYDGAFKRDEPFTDADQVVGLIAKFDISPGTLLTKRLLDVPHDIERGDALTVIAETGRARVEAQCIAEESGRAGDIIPVHNARSGRRFRVLIQARGKAVIASSDALGLIATDVNR